MPELSPKAVAAIRADYEAGELTLAAVRARHGLTRHRLDRLRIDGVWARRGCGPPDRKAAPRPQGAPSPRALAVRLLRTIERQITALEMLMADDTRQPRASDARLAAALARGLDQAAKLTAPNGIAARTREHAADADTDAARDLEWRRERLRQRVARLAQRARSGSRDGDA